MRDEITIVNPMEQPEWDRLVAANEGWTFFHTVAWTKVLWDTYRYRPLYFVRRDGDRLGAVIPLMEIDSCLTGRRGVSLPFTDYCGPIVADGCRVEDLHDAVSAYGKAHGWKSIEYRGGCFPGVAPTASFYRHTLPLETDLDRMFSRLKDTTRRNVRKAAREGVEIRVLQSAEAVDEYYRLHCMTRKKHGVPPQPHAFFRKIHEHVIARGLGRIVLASHKGRNIAGDVFFGLGGKAIYKYGASDYAYQHLRPSDLVMWEGIKWHAENGYGALCFGRTEPDNEGLRRFKCQWGAQEETINYYRYDLRRETFVESTPHDTADQHRVLTAMPIPLLVLLGRLLYRHVG